MLFVPDEYHANQLFGRHEGGRGDERAGVEGLIYFTLGTWDVIASFCSVLGRGGGVIEALFLTAISFPLPNPPNPHSCKLLYSRYTVFKTCSNMNCLNAVKDIFFENFKIKERFAVGAEEEVYKRRKNTKQSPSYTRTFRRITNPIELFSTKCHKTKTQLMTMSECLTMNV